MLCAFFSSGGRGVPATVASVLLLPLTFYAKAGSSLWRWDIIIIITAGRRKAQAGTQSSPRCGARTQVQTGSRSSPEGPPPPVQLEPSKKTLPQARPRSGTVPRGSLLPRPGASPGAKVQLHANPGD